MKLQSLADNLIDPITINKANLRLWAPGLAAGVCIAITLAIFRLSSVNAPTWVEFLSAVAVGVLAITCTRLLQRRSATPPANR